MLTGVVFDYVGSRGDFLEFKAGHMRKQLLMKLRSDGGTLFR